MMFQTLYYYTILGPYVDVVKNEIEREMQINEIINLRAGERRERRRGRE